MVGMQKKARSICKSLVLLLLFVTGECVAQDMEPRRWTHLPSDLNVFGVGVGSVQGDIYFDPVMRVDDATFEQYPVAASYVRTFALLGRSSRVDFSLPWVTGHWKGLVDGEYASVRRHGFGDPRVRFSINLYGAPALKGREFMEYRSTHPVNTTIGAAVSVTMPWGEYFADRLINLGGNRTVFRPQLGVLHQHGKWQLEATGTVALFQTNNHYYAGTVLEQDPLWFLQGHVIYGFKPGWWVSLSGGFSYGGEARINGVPKDNDDRSRYAAVSLGMPLTASQALKFTFVNSDTNVNVGASANSLVLAWSVNWGR